MEKLKSGMLGSIIAALALCAYSEVLGQTDGQIVFSYWHDGDSSLFIADADGSNQRQLTDEKISDMWPEASPDGTKIAFVSRRLCTVPCVHIMDLSTNDITRVSDRCGSARSPSWSPDGTKLVYAYKEDTEECGNEAGNWDLYTTNIDGTETTKLTDSPYRELSPSWSPDGSRIAFSTDRDGNQEIYVMDIDGMNWRNLTNHPASDGAPDWSTDGTQIVFATDRDEGNIEIYKISSEGDGITNITNHIAFDTEPRWTAAGDILFSSDRDGDFDIYRVDSDGSNTMNLTNLQGIEESPSWLVSRSSTIIKSRSWGEIKR